MKKTMPVLTRHLVREVLRACMLALLALVALFAFFDFVNELESLKKGSYGIFAALMHVLLLVPGRAYELFPIATLIGALYALTTLARHSEMTVIRTCGVSVPFLLRILSLAGLVMVVATFVIGEAITPAAERAAQQWKLTATGSTVTQQLRSGLWIRDGRRFVNVRRLLPDGGLEDVYVYDFAEDGMLKAVHHAARGEYDDSLQSWGLQQIRQTQIVAGGESVAQKKLEHMQWQSDLTPKMLSVLMVQPERMTLVALYSYISYLQDNHQNAERFRIAFWKKLVYPFSALVMIVLALPFALSHQRMTPVSAKIFLGVMLGVAFYLLNGLFSSLGTINAWPPVLAALTPSLIFLLTAIALIAWFERR